MITDYLIKKYFEFEQHLINKKPLDFWLFGAMSISCAILTILIIKGL